MTSRALLLALASGVVALACGGGAADPGTAVATTRVTGTIAGAPVTLTHASYILLPDAGYSEIALADRPLCETPTPGVENFATFQLLRRTEGGWVEADGTGTYAHLGLAEYLSSLLGVTKPAPGLYETVTSAGRLGLTSSTDCTLQALAFADGGTVTATVVDAPAPGGRRRGRIDLVFGADRLSGTFDATYCDLPGSQLEVVRCR